MFPFCLRGAVGGSTLPSDLMMIGGGSSGRGVKFALAKSVPCKTIEIVSVKMAIKASFVYFNFINKAAHFSFYKHFRQGFLTWLSQTFLTNKKKKNRAEESSL
jgi:hypothetical protein